LNFRPNIEADHAVVGVFEKILWISSEGKTLKDILEIYNVYTSNIGSSSEATFVNRKVKEVIDMLSNAVNSLPEYERKIVKAYIDSIQ
jgi:DNA mismatch repair protein MutH